MRRYVVGFILLSLIALAVFAYKPAKNAVQKAKTVYALANQYPILLDAYHILTKELEVSTKELQQLTTDWKKHDSKQVEALRDEISHLKAIVVQGAEKIVSVPQQPQNKPETLDSALHQIQLYANIVQLQSGNIEALQSINTNQGIIIERQDLIIEKQSTYISQFESLIEIHLRRSNRNIMIGTAIGIAVGVLL